MGMAAMLVTWSRPFKQFFFPKGPGGCIWNLVTIDLVVSEKKSFEIVDDGRTDDGACLYYKPPPGAFGSGELKTCEQANCHQSWMIYYEDTNHGWLVGCFGFNGLLRQNDSISVYIRLSPKEREDEKRKIDEIRKCPNKPHPHLLQALQALALLWVVRWCAGMVGWCDGSG